MEEGVYVLPLLAIERLLLDGLSAAGLQDDIAAAGAYARARSHAIQQAVAAWTTWTVENCLGCAHNPDTCPFLNGTDAGGASVRHGLAKSIEAGPFPCPARVTDEARGTPPSSLPRT